MVGVQHNTVTPLFCYSAGVVPGTKSESQVFTSIRITAYKQVLFNATVWSMDSCPIVLAQDDSDR